MPRFSLPKIPRLSPLVLFLIFILLILAVEAGYYYLKVIRKPALPPSEIQRRVEEKAEIARGEQEKLEQEIEAQQEEERERPILLEECQEVYIEDPKNGIYRLDKISENTYDYFYKGKVINVEEKTEGGCLYISLLLTPPIKGGDNFTLILPSGLLAKTDLGDVYPEIYKDHLNQRVEVKIRLEQSWTDPKAFKIIEWLPLVFYID